MVKNPLVNVKDYGNERTVLWTLQQLKYVDNTTFPIEEKQSSIFINIKILKTYVYSSREKRTFFEGRHVPSPWICIRLVERLDSSISNLESFSPSDLKDTISWLSSLNVSLPRGLYTSPQKNSATNLLSNVVRIPL